jgi:ferredoxin
MREKEMRKIITINEELCDGCGLCVKACHEGAIQLIDGKARLVSDIYCDGLGDCIGECPQGAITMESREALPFDTHAVAERQKASSGTSDPLPCGCPGTASQDLRRPAQKNAPCSSSSQGRELPRESRLGNWPVQLSLVPEEAPYLAQASLVMAADCTAFAHPDFHGAFLKAGEGLCLIGCPKLDDAARYEEKLFRIFSRHETPHVRVVYMEVPCCGGLVRLVQSAASKANHDMDVVLTKISVRGEVMEEKTFCYRKKE